MQSSPALHFTRQAAAFWRAGCLRASMKVGLISASFSLSLIASHRRSPRMTVLGISRHFAYSGRLPIVTCALSKASNEQSDCEEGIVSPEFSIAGKGHAQDLQRSYAEAGDPATSAQTMLQRAAFRVGPGWEARGYEKLRFAMEFQFSIDEPGQGRHCHGVRHLASFPGTLVH
jgi:hypothetical protein